MDSYEVLREAVAETGAKSVASDMNLSPSLIYKWCQPKGEDQSGADNPLDRLLTLCRVTGSAAPIVWLCEQMDAIYVENTGKESELQPDVHVLDMTQRILREFSDMLDTVSHSLRDDGGVDEAEARRIRSEWEELKRVAEPFVRGCEQGVFQAT